MNPKPILHGLMIAAITIVLGVTIGLWALLYFAQDRLIFFPQPFPDRLARAPGLAISEVRVATFDGLSLRGWLVRPVAAEAKRLPLAIYFGGNAEEVSHMAASAGHIRGWSLLAVNYRGYGGNPGTPSEPALFADALALYDWAALRTDVDPVRIVAIGRSLGSGVAVYMAAERPLAGVVLITPYDSFRAVAQRHYRYAPVSLLLRHSFDSIGRAPGISVPVLMLVAQRDEVVPPAHAQALFSKWAGPKTWREFAGAGHNDLDADPAYWNEIASFLRQISRR